MKIIIQDKMARSIFSTLVAVFGVLLLIFGIALGNSNMSSPNLEKYKQPVWESRVNAGDLADWIIQGRRTFHLIAFRANEDVQYKGQIKTSNVLDPKKLDDLSWLRSRFPDVTVPMIVYGEDNEESIMIASKMRYYGYNARMLEGGFNAFFDDYLQPIYFPQNASPEMRKKLLKAEARYRYFSGKDDNLGRKKKFGTAEVKKIPRKASLSVEGC